MNRGNPAYILTGLYFAVMVKGGKGGEALIAQETPQQPQDAPQDPTASEERRSRSQAFWEWLGLGKGGEKTGLDLLQVVAALSIPVVVVVMASIFTASQSRSQQDAEESRAQAQMDAEEQRAQDQALQAYLEEMGSLLLDRDLRNSEEDEEVRTLAEARTSTVLSRVDGHRKRSVVLFLYNSKLIGNPGVLGDLPPDPDPPLVRLSDTDLSDADLSDARLQQIKLIQADLIRANLSDAILVGADVKRADLSDAHLPGADAHTAQLTGAHLIRANLTKATLAEASLELADLSDADLSDADLTSATLSMASLRRADLQNAILRRADLISADVRRANLSRANLSDATNVNILDLEKNAKSLEGTTMPDGSVHD